MQVYIFEVVIPNWLLAIVPIALALVFARYALGRITCRGHAVRIRSDIKNRPPGTPTADGLLRLCSYNIAHGRGLAASNFGGGSRAAGQARLEQIAAMLRGTRADFAVLNEVDFCSLWSGHRNQAAALAELAGFPYRVEQRNFDVALPGLRWQFGNVLLSRYPIVEAQRLDLPAYRCCEAWLAGKKQALSCIVQIAPGLQLAIVAVHLEPRDEPTRVAAAERLVDAARASPCPVIIAGDFNSAPPGFPQQPTDADGRTALGGLLSQGFHGWSLFESTDEQLTYPSSRPTMALDWILVDSRLRLTNYEILDVRHSDHRPVVASIVL